MNKRQCELIEAIVAINKSASEQFLTRFTVADLEKYLLNLQSLVEIPVTGDCHRYDKYFSPSDPCHDELPANDIASEEVAPEENEDMVSAEIDDVALIPTSECYQTVLVESDSASIEQNYGDCYSHVESVILDQSYRHDRLEVDAEIPTAQVVGDYQQESSLPCVSDVGESGIQEAQHSCQEQLADVESESDHLVAVTTGGHEEIIASGESDSDDSWML